MRYLSIVLVLFMCSCSASWHVKRAQKKDPSIFVVDTIRTVDTIYFEVARIDTLFKYKFDTVEFWKDSVYVKYFYQREDSTVYLEVDCPDSQEIIKTNTVTNTITLQATFKEKAKYAGIGVGIFLAFCVLLYLVMKAVKPY